ncbi:MAG: galactose oxidase [Woeseiaceae bacterium]|nr:galactose oxidase [Woeseiaceae bacterium]
MRTLFTYILLMTLGVTHGGYADTLFQSESLPALPIPVSNNAVVAVTTEEGVFLASFAGLAEGKTHSDTLDRSFVYSVGDQEWHEAEPVPGNVGRLAAVAVSAGGRAFVFGGYTVAEDGTEVSTPFVHAFDPATGVYERRADMPVPVDDAVAVTFENRYIYLVSGWHDLGNVNLVQRYDTVTDTWAQATPTPGPAVFGHAGGISGNTIVYCDGVAVVANKDRRRDFAAVDRCFQGIIDPDDNRRIDWRSVPPHPGASRYRMAAAGHERGVLFLGGSANPYNYDGIGYNGKESEPAAGAFEFDVVANRWREIGIDGTPTMDHRGLVRLGDAWLTIGGMLGEQRVTSRVYSYRPQE